MIQIQQNNLDQLAKKYYKLIEKYVQKKDTKYQLDEINCDLLHLFDKDLEQIVTAKPSQMRDLIQ